MIKNFVRRFGKNSRSVLDKNLNQVKPIKAWERDNMSKDVWFKEKYGHIHAMQKEYRDKQKIKRNLMLQNSKNNCSYKVKHKFDNQTGQKIAQLYKNPLLEYVYGTNSVIAALQNEKRQFKSKLYYVPPLKDDFIEKLCNDKNIRLIPTTKHDLNILSNQGVHNKVILETKPLKIPFVSYLGTVSTEKDEMNTSMQKNDLESTERGNLFTLFETKALDENSANSIMCSFTKSDNKRFPLGLMLDEIVDTHNLGAIIRSAFYLGVDFILLTQKNSAPLTPVVNKASSGALELLPIYSLSNSNEFIKLTQKNSNWIFISSHIAKNKKSNKNFQDKFLPANELTNMLQESPIILIMGNENKGVNKNLLKLSDYLVQIPAGRETQSIDSLNVSVATSILLSQLLCN